MPGCGTKIWMSRKKPYLLNLYHSAYRRLKPR
jgi:hypothetical protein